MPKLTPQQISITNHGQNNLYYKLFGLPPQEFGGTIASAHIVRLGESLEHVGQSLEKMSEKMNQLSSEHNGKLEKMVHREEKDGTMYLHDSQMYTIS